MKASDEKIPRKEEGGLHNGKVIPMWIGKDRRRGMERRSGKERRSGVERRSSAGSPDARRIHDVQTAG
jgi:hypothetical protein